MNLAHQQPKWGSCQEKSNEEDKAADLKSNHLSISRPGGGYQPQLAEPCSTLYNPFWPDNNISSNNNFVKALLTDHNHCRVYLDRLLRNYCFFSGWCWRSSSAFTSHLLLLVGMLRGYFTARGRCSWRVGANWPEGGGGSVEGGFGRRGLASYILGSGVLPQTCFHVRCLLPNSFSSFLLVPLQYLVTIERMTKSSWEHILLNISNTWTRLRDRVDLEFTHVDVCTSKSLAGQREVMYTLMGEGALVGSWTQILNILYSHLY